jgi:hypothetical protein
VGGAYELLLDLLRLSCDVRRRCQIEDFEVLLHRICEVDRITWRAFGGGYALDMANPDTRRRRSPCRESDFSSLREAFRSTKCIKASEFIHKYHTRIVTIVSGTDIAKKT